ncbi:MAG: EMC3/TMCO1 family protein [Candidatus Poseidoniaceae archaeon]|nr:EMC3/TMCO1 family protein [Candidatus Poseidoniaceae archaeon]
MSTPSAPGGPAPPAPPQGAMFTMLAMMLMMVLLVVNPSIRNTLGDIADPILSPVLPEERFVIITLLILGSASMLVNTVLRNLFMDPIAQAHLQHRQGQVRQIMNEARMSRDSTLQDKAMTLQQQMMPEQLSVQMGAMKPMMFTMVFIIAIFAWLTTTVEDFRVDYISLPWAPEWGLNDRFLLFPAWICAYICMSAPLGRVVDRHIKLLRYRRHPLVEAAETIPEPLLHLIQGKKGGSDASTKRRQEQRRRRDGPRKRNDGSASKAESEEASEAPVAAATKGVMCPTCWSDQVRREGPRTKVCQTCFHEWV